MNFTLSAEILGVLGAFVAGLLSLIPALGATDLRRNITALVVIIVGAIVWGGIVFTSNINADIKELLSIAVYAVVTYKIFVQNFVVKPIQNTLTNNVTGYSLAIQKRQ